jgi:hypothetical protein
MFCLLLKITSKFFCRKVKKLMESSIKGVWILRSAHFVNRCKITIILMTSFNDIFLIEQFIQNYVNSYKISIVFN